MHNGNNAIKRKGRQSVHVQAVVKVDFTYRLSTDFSASGTIHDQSRQEACANDAHDDLTNLEGHEQAIRRQSREYAQGQANHKQYEAGQGNPRSRRPLRYGGTQANSCAQHNEQPAPVHGPEHRTDLSLEIRLLDLRVRESQAVLIPVENRRARLVTHGPNAAVHNPGEPICAAVVMYMCAAV